MARLERHHFSGPQARLQHQPQHTKVAVRGYIPDVALGKQCRLFGFGQDFGEFSGSGHVILRLGRLYRFSPFPALYHTTNRGQTQEMVKRYLFTNLGVCG